MVTNMTAARKKYLSIILLIFVGLILIIALASMLGSANQEPSGISSFDTAAGAAYLTGLESKDPTEVEEQLKLIRQQELQAQKEELINQLTSGEVSVWSMFEDYALLGDSRSVGFTYYGFLPDSNVWAESGATIRNMEQHIPALVSMAPSYIFLCYGMNDFCSGFWTSPEEYVADYKEQLLSIQAALPDSDIYICSILPASDAAYARANIWSVIPSYNEALKAMCDELDHCYYIDGDPVAEQHMDLWEQDGIHFKKEFYPHWAASLIMGIFDAENSEDIADDI